MKALAASLGITVPDGVRAHELPYSTSMVLQNCCKPTANHKGYWHLYRQRLVEGVVQSTKAHPNQMRDGKTWQAIHSLKAQIESSHWAHLGDLMHKLTAHLTPMQLAHLRVCYFDTSATLRDYYKLGIVMGKPRLPPGTWAPDPYTMASIPDHWTPEIATEWYARGESGTGAIIQLTLTTVSRVLQRRLTQWEKELCASNVGEPEWTVAAMLLGLNCIAPTVRNYIVDSKMHWVALRYWPKQFAAWMNAIKRCPILPPPYSAMPQEVLLLRKVFSCCLRTHAEADWSAEWDRRTQNLPVHWALTPQGTLSRTLWVSDIMATTTRLSKEIVDNTADNIHPKDIWEWWADRTAWMPSGSSSARADIMHKLRECSDEDYSAMARPSKKELAEQLPNDWPEHILRTSPMRIARGSTKPEPGGKQRALYAVADDHFFIAAFASLHVEKHMNVWGMKAKQAPADVCQWILQDVYAPRGSFWNSLDYSDYNSEHEAWQLALMSGALGERWWDRYRVVGEKYTKHRAQCSEWVAMAQYNSWAQIGQKAGATTANGTPIPANMRLYAGLYSGDRDTARDNTLLHGVYSAVGMLAVQRASSTGSILENNMTGDDEDALFTDWVTSALYLETHRQEGFVLKNAKQQCGELHEFLQRQAGGGVLPTRPLFALLAQLSSGNWYHDVHIWYDASVPAVSDNLWEAHTRGMPISYARRLATIILDATMRVPIDTDGVGPRSWKYLEWWSYRHGASEHPLWAGTSGPVLEPINIDAKPLAPRSYPRLATDAYIDARRSQLPLSDEKWERYAAGRLKESYATWFLKRRADTHAHYARQFWPERTASPSEADMNVQPWRQMQRAEAIALLCELQPERRPTTTAEVLARMDLDDQLLSLVGGWARLRSLLPPELLARYEQPVEPRLPRREWWNLDPALRSALSHSFAAPEGRGIAAKDPLIATRAIEAARRQTHGKLPMTHNVVRLVLAPNGAGKTTFTMHNPQYMDLDQAVIDTGTYAAYRKFSKHQQRLIAPIAARDAIWALLRARQQIGMVAQYAPASLIPPPAERSWALQIIVVQPPVPLLMERLEARQWSAERITKKLSRWFDGVRDLPTLANLTAQEKNNIIYSPTWEI